MPFAFTLPTTSHLSFQSHISSSTHPSLPLAASTQRTLVRNALKTHKRLPVSQQPAHLPTVLFALNEYVPYLTALDAGLSSSSEITCTLLSDLTPIWRSSLTPSSPRTKLRSLEAEIFLTLTTLAITHYALARAAQHTLHTSDQPTAAVRSSALSSASKSLLTAHSLWAYLITRLDHSTSLATTPIPELSASILNALTSLTLSEATLLALSTTDPYPPAIALARSTSDKSWMISAPSIPSVRLHLLARLALAASDHARHASASISTASAQRITLDPDLARFTTALQRCGRAKAARLLGVDADATGRTGEGIAWLRGARAELALSSSSSSSSSSGSEESSFRRWRAERANAKEDKLVTRGGEWGLDGGCVEEGRVVEALDRKWSKMNDTVNVQVVPKAGGLLAGMPSGREYFGALENWKMPRLEEAALTRLRVLVEVDPQEMGSSSDEVDVPGTFPGGSYY